MGNLAGWPYWKVASITGQAGSGTNYQVELEIGDSAGGDFHLEGHCTNFPQDIRITDDDGTTLLDHFVEDLTADPIVVHVEVKDDLGSNRDIRVYYGKSGETTVSNGVNTFPALFDDFNNASIDGTLWDTVLTPTESGGVITCNQSNERIVSKSTFGINTGLKFRGYVANDTGTPLFGFRSGTSTPLIEWVSGVHTSGYIHGRCHESGNAFTTQNIAVNNWATFEIKRTTNNVKFSIDNAVSDTVTTQVTETALPIEIIGYDSNENKWDWVYISKYNLNEPAFNSAGAEQSPTGVAPTGVFYGPLIGPFGGPI